MDKYAVTGMSCAACQARVEKAVQAVPGVESCAVSLLTNSMGVQGDAKPEAIIEAVEKAGYGASLFSDASEASSEASKSRSESALADALIDRETPRLRRRLIASVVFVLALMYITMGHNMWGWPLPAFFAHNHLALALTQMILAAIVMLINKDFFTSGFRSLLHGAPNMDTLIALGSSVSFVWSIVVFYRMCGMVTAGVSNEDLMPLYHNQLYFESAAMILALITVGKMLEAMSKGKTTNALKSLLRLTPKRATLLRDGAEVEVDVAAVQSGDIFIVRPGESIPVDGVVTEGTSAVDESALTGESIPVDKEAGSTVAAATINRSGFLTCRATRVGEDTTISQIIRMVSDAAATKAPIARIADKISGIFVPLVIGIALLVIIGWLIAGRELSFALARGISVLVISCPCALGLATPVAIMVGNGVGAKNGILFKTSESLENAGRIDTVALDKTGTITSGAPHVTDLLPADGHSAEELLQTAYALEKKSEHPLAKAIVWHAEEKGMTAQDVEDFEALPGNGLRATLSGATLHAGSGKHIRTICKVDAATAAEEAQLAKAGKTPIFIAKNEELIGIIAVADVAKDDAAAAIAQMKGLGLQVVMLTGDNADTARAIGDAAGVDQVVAGVLPDGKEKEIRTLQAKGKVAMVGDGINDAPALVRADTGIAIGAGTDVAIDSADIVLVNSALLDVPAAVRLSRATLRNIHQNLFWAFFYNLICIPLAAGLFKWEMNPMIAAAAMSLSSFTVCMNALRLNLFDPHNAKHDRAKTHRAPASGDLAVEEARATDEKQGRETTMEKTIKVEGMMCENCERHVQKALEALPQVESAKADHEANEVVMTVTEEIADEVLAAAIDEAGYRYIA